MDLNATNRVPYDLRLMVERRLDRDEEIRWIGQPKARRLLLNGGIFIIAAAVLGGWFVYFGFTWLNENYFSPARDPEKPYLWLACIPMFLIGSAMLYLSVWLARRCTRTVCAVTNKRAIILFTPRKIEFFGPSKLKAIKKRLHRDGTGDLIFAKHIYYDRGSRRETEYGFNDIEKVDEVEKLLRELADSADS